MTERKKPKMIYSADEKNRSEIAFFGECIVRSEADIFFGGDLSKPYQSEVMSNPNWRQLYQCAKDQQKCSNDYHHAYFEDFSVVCVEILNDKEVSVLRLHMGS